MASFGAERLLFAPHADTQPTNGLPMFGPAVTLGRLVSANLTVALASGELYADNIMAENISEFASADLAAETDDMTDDVAGVVYGATVEGGQVNYRAGDAPPPGGVVYVKTLVRDGARFYRGYFYPNASAAIGNDTAQTKGSSITFGTSSTAFKIKAWAPTDDWRITKEFTTKQAAFEWCDEMLSATPAP